MKYRNRLLQILSCQILGKHKIKDRSIWILWCFKKSSFQFGYTIFVALLSNADVLCIIVNTFCSIKNKFYLCIWRMNTDDNWTLWLKWHNWHTPCKKSIIWHHPFQSQPINFSDKCWSKSLPTKFNFEVKGTYKKPAMSSITLKRSGRKSFLHNGYHVWAPPDLLCQDFLLGVNMMKNSELAPTKLL